MDKNKELTKLEEEKKALQKKIDNLKKSDGQIKFEEWLKNIGKHLSI
jgi:hypothetical protein